MDTEALVVDAFAQRGFDAVPVIGTLDDGGDLLVDPNGVHCELRVKYRSLMTEAISIYAVASRCGPSGC